jgi:CO dehydrogenase maturation factor
LAQRGRAVYAIDADPDANLAHALGMPSQVADRIRPLAADETLVEERTGAKRGRSGQLFSLSPDVHDIAQKYAISWKGVQTLVLGAVTKGGGGCACPESALLKALVRHLVLRENDFVLLDMEAGIEHLGRATASGVDALIVVVESGSRSIDTARHIVRLAGEIDLAKRCHVLINKAREPQRTAAAVQSVLPETPLLGAIAYDERCIEADENRACLVDIPEAQSIVASFEQALDAMISFTIQQHKKGKSPHE